MGWAMTSIARWRGFWIIGLLAVAAYILNQVGILGLPLDKSDLESPEGRFASCNEDHFTNAWRVAEPSDGRLRSATVVSTTQPYERLVLQADPGPDPQHAAPESDIYPGDSPVLGETVVVLGKSLNGWICILRKPAVDQGTVGGWVPESALRIRNSPPSPNEWFGVWKTIADKTIVIRPGDQAGRVAVNGHAPWPSVKEGNRLDGRIGAKGRFVLAEPVRNKIWLPAPIDGAPKGCARHLTLVSDGFLVVGETAACRPTGQEGSLADLYEKVSA